ncbi:hypothetical protein [Clostridium perfringens]|uniref:Serine/threonine kinase n=1 Tax=Clostridium perfringens TaxID=1502 RepID=A0A133N4I7_CLOPF|nr:hypothetical protein [Clostridium perfringens]KXA11196.1 hypothetical protein HMPREF3222_01820 [Clostridium perfringens]MBS5921498.1 hypothetical protein [Clostridium perfringens]
MSKNFDYSLKDISSNLEKSLKEAELLGEGHNGVVFLLKNNRAIKIFRRMSVWKDESSILKRVRKSRFFPRIYEAKQGYIIREYVDGVRLDKYLRRGNLDEELCKELYLMILEFERLGFKRIDIRCKDIYIQDDYTLKIIDPKNNYRKRVSFPRHLFKGLFKRDELNRFLNYVAEIDEKRAHIWREKFEIYAEDKDLLI